MKDREFPAANNTTLNTHGAEFSQPRVFFADLTGDA
jgi:hypothetical protein